MNASRSAGFTLIELVVTVAIVSLLATMAMPLTQLITKRSREHELRASLREIRDALDRYNELWRYSCQNPAAGGAGGQGGVGGTALPNNGAFGAAPGLVAPGGVSGAGVNNGAASAFGSPANANTPGGAGTVAGAGLGGAGGVSASTVQGIGGSDGKGGTAAPATPPKMECPTVSSGWPKDLQTLADGVKNITSPTPGAKIYFLRRIPRDPMNPDSSIAADLTWGKRSSASPPDEPQEGEDLYDVYSLSTAKDLTGQPYRDW
jgi:prepilin-type N-terminal cleavage/methylation domain-containing protein